MLHPWTVVHVPLYSLQVVACNAPVFAFSVLNWFDVLHLFVTAC